MSVKKKNMCVCLIRIEVVAPYFSVQPESEVFTSNIVNYSVDLTLTSVLKSHEIILMRDENKTREEMDLLAKIAERDELAFSKIYHRYHKKIYTFTARLLHSKPEAEEVLQETFLKLWTMGTELKKIQNVEAYLVTISRNRALDRLRRQRPVINVDPENGPWTEQHNETEEAILLNDAREILERGISLLPPQQKKVYQLCHQEGLKYEEAAAQLNLSPFTVKTHMQHALSFLRAYLIKNNCVLLALIAVELFY